MKLVRHTVRLSAELDAAVLGLAKRRGLTAYAMLTDCVEAGVAALIDQGSETDGSEELVTELASLDARVDDIGRILDRTLFAACAAYCYARSAAMGGRKSDDIILAEINRVYDRQRASAEAGA
jgi:hypothetical protein